MDLQLGQKSRVHGFSRSTYSDSFVFYPKSAEEAAEIVDTANRLGMIISCRGDGNGYGDGALNNEQIIVQLTEMDRVLEFNSETGILRAQSGADINTVLLATIASGWMLPAMPGTRHVTLGGALANNVHGKNCYHQGYIGEHVRSIKILLANATSIECSREHNSDLFYSAISGLGLMGIILEVTLQLRRVPSFYARQLDIPYDSFGSVFEAFESVKKKYEYSICHMDTLKRGEQIGRGVLSLANFEEDGDYRVSDHEIPNRLMGVLPHAALPIFTRRFLGQKSVRLINSTKYHKAKLSNSIKGRRVSFSALHFMVDRQIPTHNLFLSNGFYEYQAMLPTKEAVVGFTKIISLTHQYRFGSMISALKAHRPQRDPFLLTPSIEGYSLSFMIPKEPRRTKEQFKMMDEMNETVIQCGGKLYLAKTPVVTEKHYRSMYENVDTFLKVKAKFDPQQRFQSNLYRRIFQLNHKGLVAPSRYEV